MFANRLVDNLHIAAEPGRRLSIGAMLETPPKSSDDLFSRLRDLGIVHRTYQHPPLFTVEQSKAQRGILDGSHIKNLFLRDKKRQMWLVTVEEERVVDLKKLRHTLGAQGNLSFGSPELLMEVLGVLPGAVTPFAIINDHEMRVTLVLDEVILRQDMVNAHPLRNDMTTAVAAQDLLKFAAAEAHTPIILDFNESD